MQVPRRRFGLDEHWNLYLCMQNLRKIHPDFDAMLATILRHDPHGHLLLLEDPQAALGKQLRQRFLTSMPDVAGRVRFMPRAGYADYLALIALADVVLDTPHYGGGANTTYDALALGVPVVTLPGRFQRGRYAQAAYRQIGLLDAIASSPDGYVATALRLGSDRAARKELSTRLREAVPALFDDQQAAVELADFFAQAVEARL